MKTFLKKYLFIFCISGLLSLIVGSCTRNPTTLPPATQVPQPSIETPSPEPTFTAVPPTATISLLPPFYSQLGEQWTRPIDGMTMVYVPGSDVQIGSSQDEIDAAFDQCEVDRGEGMCDRYWFEDEYPIHSVHLGPFWIDMHEITNINFASFLNDQGNQTEGGVAWLDLSDENAMIEQIDDVYQPKEGFGDHPVVEVSWYGALAYCQWVGGWLPSEEKWEYAARGPERYTYPWGNDAPDCDKANVSGCSTGTMSVGGLPAGASWIGLQDMGGNVWEWVANWYLRYPGSQHEDEDFGQIYKIVRGGSWYYEPYYARSACRTLEFYPYTRSNTIGFRCVINVDE